MKIKGLQLIEIILGLWVLISPWVVPAALLTSNVIAGILIILIECVENFGGKTKPQV